MVAHLPAHAGGKDVDLHRNSEERNATAYIPRSPPHHQKSCQPSHPSPPRHPPQQATAQQRDCAHFQTCPQNLVPQAAGGHQGYRFRHIRVHVVRHKRIPVQLPEHLSGCLVVQDVRGEPAVGELHRGQHVPLLSDYVGCVPQVRPPSMVEAPTAWRTQSYPTRRNHHVQIFDIKSH